MKKLSFILLSALCICVLVADETLAQRGRGGGGARGGGGYREGTGGSAAGNRPSPSPSYNRSPSMSRTAPTTDRSAQRPSGERAGASAATRPSMNTPAASGKTAMQSPRSFDRPSQGQLSGFLNSSQPKGGALSATATPPASQLPTGGQTRTITTAGGTQITVGAKSGSGLTGSGATVGGAGLGIKVEGPGGQTYVKGKGTVGATDGANAAIRTGSITGAEGAAGNKAVNVRGGYADTAGNQVVRGATGVQTRSGYTAVNVRGGYGAGGTGSVGSVTAVRGPAGNVVTAGHGASFINGQFVAGQSWQAVNGNFTNWNYYTAAWYRRYPGAWFPGKWAIATTAWAAATWATAGAYCGCSGDPAYYDYGQNVTYDDGTVSQDGQPVATAEQYYEEANTIADAGQDAKNEEWLPLGVFAVIKEGETNSDKLVQLAVNKDAVIRGNYQDLVANKLTPVIGSVDKKTQRVALKIEGNNSLVVETGLYNLTNDEVPVLVHFDKHRQEERLLVRLSPPESSSEAK